ncbi:MAG TPA: hypothetical protein EYP86_01965 [Candidatus Altiarchaeales archaeon]|nr:hypothetical protein [Candidatus Altiarchaeales archaeon]
MSNKHCWEYWKCPDNVRKKCNAYKLDEEENCWDFFDFVNSVGPLARKRGIRRCINCPFFKMKNPEFGSHTA